MNPADVTGLILAGGQSRRFGADKARHPVAGRAMIAHVYAALAPVAETVYVSMPQGGGHGDAFGLPVGIVEDAVPDAGPLAGLHAGLGGMTTPWLLAVACDLPFITPDALRRLLAHATPGTAAVVAETPSGRAQPLCAVYHASVRATAEAHLADGRRALHALLDALDVVRYVSLPEAVLRNINRPGDLR